jgi:hypothetical protein
LQMSTKMPLVFVHSDWCCRKMGILYWCYCKCPPKCHWCLRAKTGVLAKWAFFAGVIACFIYYFYIVPEELILNPTNEIFKLVTIEVMNRKR